MANNPDNGDEDGRHTGRGDQRRPDLDGLSIIGTGKKTRAKTGHSAGWELADNSTTRLMAIATFIEANRNGTEAGRRSFHKTCQRDAL